MIDTTHRSDEREIMDDMNLQGAELERTLKDLDKVNSWLGGNRITLEGIQKLLKRTTQKRPVKIIDVGCGNGSMLKQVAQWGRDRGISMELLGIDANPHATEIAHKNLEHYPEVNFIAMDVFSKEFASMDADIILCTLTLHHFSDQEIRTILPLFVSMVSMGVVINDLQRSRLAYSLFKVFCSIFSINEINRKDGLTSILRSFKKQDIRQYGQDLVISRQEIHWKLAFRYQWILFK